MAASTASSFSISTNVVLISNLGVKFLEKHMFLHKLFYLIRCGLQHNCIKVGVIAPIPEADTFAVSVSTAIALSKYKLLGEEWRDINNNLPYCLQRYQT
jgi:hypothetical protein